MSALSVKAQRQAAPIEKLPFELTRKYGEPVLFGSAADVRIRIRADLDELEKLGKHWGDTLNRPAIADARAQLGQWCGDTHLSIEFVADHHTGVKYSVVVKDRRIP